MPSAPAFVRTAAIPVKEDKRFIGVDAIVLEFWQWAVSDPRMTITRSMLAEFLVPLAVDTTGTSVVSWTV